MLDVNDYIMKNTGRVEVADALRGLAVLGIVLIHSLENYNLFNFPPTTSEWMRFIDTALFDLFFFIFAGKAYGIFALLFGFSFFIQDNNNLKRGYDFRFRFLWRLVLLFIWGIINSIFYTGDVLAQYALIGVVLILTARLSTKTVLIIASILILQPVEWGKLIYALCNPDYVPAESMVGYHFSQLGTVLMNKEASLGEVFSVMWNHSQLATITWSWENGRFPQIAALFMFGMVIGRTGFFFFSEDNIKRWVRILIIAVICFFTFKGLLLMLPDFVKKATIFSPLEIIARSFANVSFMTFLIMLILILFYTTKKGHAVLQKLTVYGKMSLTNYITQSIIGGAIFYSWGLGLSVSKTV